MYEHLQHDTQNHSQHGSTGHSINHLEDRSAPISHQDLAMPTQIVLVHEYHSIHSALQKHPMPAQAAMILEDHSVRRWPANKLGHLALSFGKRIGHIIKYDHRRVKCPIAEANKFIAA